jgi:hypothetical protein
MTDVRELFDRVLEEPAPPLAPCSAVIGVARRRRRRQRGALAVTCAAVAVGAVLVAPRFGLGGAAPDGPADNRSAEVTSSQSADPDRVTGGIGIEDMYAALLAAVRGRVTLLHHAGEGWADLDRTTGGVGAFADFHIGDRGGQLHAYLEPGPARAPRGDLCDVPPIAEVMTGPETSCTTMWVGDVPVRVSTKRTRPPSSDLGTSATIHTAVRFVDGWAIVVWETPWVNDYSMPMLTTPTFSDADLADMAADPGFLPPRG